VAHDFNNLLTVILGNIKFVEKDVSGTAGSKLSQRLSHMRLAAERGAKLTSQLLAFSRRQNLQPKVIDINNALGNMRDLLQSSLGGSIQIKTALRPDLWMALADPTQIELVVLNLALNGRDAMEVGGTITLETNNVTVGPPDRGEEPPAGEYVVISVRDTGSGMTNEVLNKAFEPFFTTKEIGKGSGLGLSQVLGFAKQSGGGMRIETRFGEGTSVKLFLPRAITGQPVAMVPETDFAPRRHQGAVILLVDDDHAVRDIATSILRDLGFVVLEAGSGGAALEILERGQTNIDLVILDYAMPGMNGLEVARQMQSKIPKIPILFVTGYADQAALDEIGASRIIKKPFVGTELASKVHKALDKNSLSSSGTVSR
jgi:CheY-like chemotaxis protein